jgi:hypothetical protein
MIGAAKSTAGHAASSILQICSALEAQQQFSQRDYRSFSVHRREELKAFGDNSQLDHCHELRMYDQELSVSTPLDS